MKEKNKQLSLERQNLVRDNHNLIYGFAKSRGLNPEEYYDILAIGLCKAGILFDPERGCNFSTLAYKMMQNECYMYWRDTYLGLKKIPKELIISYDAPFFDDENERPYLEKINDLFGTYQIDSTTAELKEFINSLTKQEKTVLYYSAIGYSQTEMTTIVGLSQSYISRVLSKIKNNWNAGDYYSIRKD